MLQIIPTHTEAQQLRDQVELRIEPTAKIALSVENQQQYQEALDLLVQDNPERALAITTRLMRIEGNANYKPLRDLHNKLLREVSG